MEFLVRCAFAVPGWLTFGIGLSLMWGWFVVPLGVQPIGWVHAMGLGAVFAFGDYPREAGIRILR